MQKAVVTGGAGFIGSHLVDRLINKGIKVTILDDLSTGKIENINPKSEFIKCDISKSTIFDLHNNIKEADVIFHLAAKARVQPSIENPSFYHDTNVNGTHNLLVATKKTQIKRFIYSSSSSVYGDAKIPTLENHPKNPMSPYALHKLIGEQYCKLFNSLYDIDTVSLRYFNVYGNRMSLEGAYRLAIPIFASQIKDNKPCTINNDGKQKRDFTYVNDVVEANILAALFENQFNGKIYNVGNGNNTSVNELVEMMGGQKSYGNKVIEPFETLADITKIKQELNWEPKGNLENWIKQYKKELNI